MTKKKIEKRLSPAQSEELISVLNTRFIKNRTRHEDIEWAEVEAKLKANPAKMWSLNEMERTGGEPDITGMDPQTGE